MRNILMSEIAGLIFNACQTRPDEVADLCRAVATASWIGPLLESSDRFVFLEGCSIANSCIVCCIHVGKFQDALDVVRAVGSISRRLDERVTDVCATHFVSAIRYRIETGAIPSPWHRKFEGALKGKFYVEHFSSERYRLEMAHLRSDARA
jgi:hypothetical protein